MLQKHTTFTSFVDRLAILHHKLVGLDGLATLGTGEALYTRDIAFDIISNSLHLTGKKTQHNVLQFRTQEVNQDNGGQWATK